MREGLRSPPIHRPLALRPPVNPSLIGAHTHTRTRQVITLSAQDGPVKWANSHRNPGMDAAHARFMLALRTTFPLMFSLALVAGCLSHTRDEDSGVRIDAAQPDAAGCTGFAPAMCVTACGSDALFQATCIDNVWACAAPRRDVSTCPPGCVGSPPPGCTCRGTEWVCPPSCSGPTPPPSCLCAGAVVGAPCANEGDDCGGCCNGLNAPSGVVYRGGVWQEAVGCTEFVCPSICPADRNVHLGEPCIGDVICGDACCDAMQCAGGTWTPGPFAGCACADSNSFACGSGTCRVHDQACLLDCRQPFGALCIPLPSMIASCSTFDLPAGFACSERDGHVTIQSNVLCE